MNFLAIVIAAGANMGLGFLWYSPALFAKPWMHLMGYTADSLKAAQKKMGSMYALSALAALVTAYVLARFGGSLTTAFWIWLGFVAPVQFTDVLFGGKKPKLFLINTGYQLAGLLTMALVLSLFG